MLQIKYKMTGICLIMFIAFAAPAYGGDNWTHFENGMKWMKRGDFSRAFGNFSYYLHQPEMHRRMFGVAYFGRGLLYESKKNYGKALVEYRLAIENDLHPTVQISDKAYTNIGTIYMGRKEYQDAIRAYASAVEINRQNGLAHYYLGLAYLRAGNYEKAEKESEEAKRLGVTFTALSDGLNKAKEAAQDKGKRSN
jgi:tetratricopeptide (TPR) repeat protein